jgi:hypothetical protein
LKKYNTYRLHKSLGGLTPMAYIQNTCSEAWMSLKSPEPLQFPIWCWL